MAQLTVRAAADRLGVGYSTLKQWIYQGRVRTTHTAGGHHRISDAEIDRLQRIPVTLRDQVVHLDQPNFALGCVPR